MHMSDALITPIVGGTMLASSGGLMGYSIRSLKVEVFEKRLPLMAVMGAFLFATQMINFAIPGTGASGHIGGGMLLSIILGPAAAFITMACVLLIQALFFADGGLLAFGCNLINLGFFTAYIAYPLIFRPMTNKILSSKSIMRASIVASIVGLQLGSLGVVLETFLSGRTDLSLMTFLLFMQPIHLAIGLVEGVITGTVVTYLYSQNKHMIYSVEGSSVGSNHRSLIIGIVVATLMIGGFVSIFASSSPDGLEWAIERTADGNEVAASSPVNQWVESFQSQVAVLPDYGFQKEGTSDTAGTTTSGIVGSLMTLMVTLIIGTAIRWKRKKAAVSYE